MAKKKVAKKAVKKVSTPRKAPVGPSRSSQRFFSKHKNLKWLLPLLLGVLIAVLLVHHYRLVRQEEMRDEVFKQQVKQDLKSYIINHKASDADKDDDVAKLTPTPTPVAY